MYERDLEDWICTHWEDTPWGFGTLIGRQVPLKHGRCDLLAFDITAPHIIELKARPIKEKDIGQILRYRHDVKTILQGLCLNNPYGYLECDDEDERAEFERAWRIASQLPPHDQPHMKTPFELTLVGTDISEKVLASASGAWISVYTYDEVDGQIEFSIATHSWRDDQAWIHENLAPWVRRLNDEVIQMSLTHVYAQICSILYSIFGNEDIEIKTSISAEWRYTSGEHK